METKSTLPWRLLLFAFALVFAAQATYSEPQQVSPPVITLVAVYHPGQKTFVRMEGTGPLDCRITRLSDPERVVLDFQGTRLAKPYSSIPSLFSPVLAVHTGQFRPDVARVVIDLERVVEYRLRAEENSVTVEFDVAASTPVPAPPAGAQYAALARPAGTIVSAPAPLAVFSPALQPATSFQPPSAPAASPSLVNLPAPSQGSFKDGMLTFQARNQSLRSVLQQIGNEAGVSIYLAEGLGNDQISVEFQHYRLDEALRQILNHYDVLFLYGQGQDALGSPPLRTVWVYPAGRAEAPRHLPEITATAGNQPAPAHTVSNASPATNAPAGAKVSDPVAELLRALENPSDEVRERAISQALLARMKIPQDTLVNLALTDASVNVRLLALRALPLDPDLRWVAERAAGDSSPYVTQAAREILRNLDLRERAKSWAAHSPAAPEP
jgi:hypothetical protein